MMRVDSFVSRFIYAFMYVYVKRCRRLTHINEVLLRCGICWDSLKHGAFLKCIYVHTFMYVNK